MNLSTSFRYSILALSLTLSIGCSEHDPAELFAQAEQAIEKRDFNAAAIQLKNILKNDGDNGKARYLLGEINYNLGNWPSAEKEYQRALESKFDKNLIVPHLAESYYRLRDSDNLTALAADRSLDANTRAVVDLYLAMQFIRNSEFEKSKSLLEQLNEQQKDSAYSMLGKAVLSGLNNDQNSALVLIDEILASYPGMAEALELKGHILLSMGKANEAADVFGQYVEMRPQSLEARLIFANTLVAAERFDDAEIQVDMLLSALEYNPLVNLLKAQILVKKQNFQEAYLYADRATQNDNPMIMARIIAGSAAFKLNNLENAYIHLSAIEASLPVNHPAYKLLAAVKLQLGYTEEAMASLDELNQIDAINSQFLAASSAELFKRGETEEAKKLLDDAEASDPNSAEVAFQRALFKFAENDKTAVDDLEKAVELDPTMSNANIALAMNYMREGDFDAAHQIAQGLHESNAVLSDALTGFIYRVEEKYDLAVASLEKVIAVEPNHAGALYNLGLIAQQNSDLAEAITFYIQVLQNAPEHKESAKQLLALSDNAAYTNQIQAFFIALNESQPNSSVAAIAAVDIYRKRGALKKALEVSELFLAEQPRNTKLLLMKGQTLVLMRDFDQAITVFDQLINITPNNQLARLSKIATLEAGGDIDGAIGAVEQAIADLPKTPMFKLVAANLYVAKNNTERANTLVTQIPEQYQESMPVIRLKGKLALMQNDFTTAIDYFQQIFQTNPNVRSLLELVSAHEQAGDISQALNLVNRASMQSEQKNLAVEMKRAELYSQIDTAKSREIYQSLDIGNPGNFAVMNNLAWTLMQEGKLDDAQTAAEKALELAPNHPDVLDTYGLIMLAQGEISSAAEALEKAFRSNQTNPYFKIHLAQARLAQGDKQGARLLLNDIDFKQLDKDGRDRAEQVKSALSF